MIYLKTFSGSGIQDRSTRGGNFFVVGQLADADVRWCSSKQVSVLMHGDTGCETLVMTSNHDTEYNRRLPRSPVSRKTVYATVVTSSITVNMLITIISSLCHVFIGVVVFLCNV